MEIREILREMPELNYGWKSNNHLRWRFLRRSGKNYVYEIEKQELTWPNIKTIVNTLTNGQVIAKTTKEAEVYGKLNVNPDDTSTEFTLKWK